MRITDGLRAFAKGFLEAWNESWPAMLRGFNRGSREALVGYWSPLRPRFWRYVAIEARRDGVSAGMKAFFRAQDHILAGRLRSDGRVRI